MGYVGANVPNVPRLKSDQERGPMGVWLRAERLRRGWKPEDVVGALTSLSSPIRVDYYRSLEAGPDQPGPELREVLGRLYGTAPAPRPSQPVLDAPGDLAAAIREQSAVLADLAKAVSALAGRVAADRDDDELVAEVVTRVQAWLQEQPAPAGSGEPREPAFLRQGRE